MKKKHGIWALCALLAAIGIWALCGRVLATESVYPVENALSRTVRFFYTRARAFGKRMSLIAESERLKAENAALGMVRVENDSILAENARLRRLLDLPKREKGMWLAAPVLGRGGAVGVNDLLRLGRGARDGVCKDAVVAVPEGLVGRVENVTPSTCTVQLLTDPNFAVACEIETSDEACPVVYGILRGGGVTAFAEASGTVVYSVNPFLMRHLRRDVKVPPRAKIVTSGRGGVFPRGIVAGYFVDAVREDETRLERSGEVLSAVEFPALENVFIRVSHRP